MKKNNWGGAAEADAEIQNYETDLNETFEPKASIKFHDSSSSVRRKNPPGLATRKNKIQTDIVTFVTNKKPLLQQNAKKLTLSFLVSCIHSQSFSRIRCFFYQMIGFYQTSTFLGQIIQQYQT